MTTTLRTAALAWLLAMTPFLLGQVRTTGWVRTFTCSGNGIAQTDTFTLAPGEWRICYRPHGSEPFSVTLRDADSGLNKRLTNQVGPNVASGVTRGSDGIKSAYLVVHGSDEGWQVWVEHYMDTVDEWNFRQSQPPRKALERLGSWTGEAAEQTVTVQVAAPHWRFSHEQLGPGRLRLDVFDATGQCLLRACTAVSGIREAWIHQSGEFTVRISAIDTPWIFHIDAPVTSTSTQDY
ncbi:MAG TPA: hypothetical protein PLE92_01250 [Lentisphaeria bacterium]|nr:hypothetical protein [Lentisphaerota bacterium]OQC16368.1 MAG: hypothetical protein BWX73_00826 [Lentisphaerae bacterium ADurb.Bin082]HQC51730.1 hypothetical protein [Lentisphaeria bacterium]HQL88857.1 hypothetical protein [Lentisphaeria bacterium]